MKKQLDNQSFGELIRNLVEFEMQEIALYSKKRPIIELSDTTNQKILNMQKVLIRREKHREICSWVCTIVASILIVVAIANPTIYLKAAEKVVDWFQDHVLVQFERESDLRTFPVVKICYVPEGYYSVECVREDYCYVEIFENAVGNIITLECYPSDYPSSIDNENITFQEFEDNGKYIYYLQANDDDNSVMIWKDNECDTEFILSSILEKEEMVKIIDSIELE